MTWDTGAIGPAICFDRFCHLFLAVLAVLRLVNFGHLLVILQINVVFEGPVVHWHCCIVGKEALIALFYYCWLTDCLVVERTCARCPLKHLHAAFWLTSVRI